MELSIINLHPSEKNVLRSSTTHVSYYPLSLLPSTPAAFQEIRDAHQRAFELENLQIDAILEFPPEKKTVNQ